MAALTLIGTGFLLSAVGALLMRARDRLGRIAIVVGATLIMAGMIAATLIGV